MVRRVKDSTARPIDAIVHRSDKRKNIPTRELRGFVREDEMAPGKLLYPRDPSLDPQLLWKGKDEADSSPFEVPVVPIYIQEKVSPQALIEDLRAVTQRGRPRQTTLFAEFNGIKFDQLVDFYHHDQHWTNRVILGDSLLVMSSLAEKEGLKGRVQMIYFDPPYGIRFDSNWQVSTRKPNVKDGRVEDVSRQPEQIRAYRDTWEFGIHSYLTYLRDRLQAAHSLLTESGSIFVQIGEENFHLVRALLDEVFGSECFVSNIVVRKTSGQDQDFIDNTCDFVLWYARDKGSLKSRRLFIKKEVGGRGANLQQFRFVELADGTRRPLNDEEKKDPEHLSPGARLFRYTLPTSRGSGGDTVFPVRIGDHDFFPAKGRHWSTHLAGMRRLIDIGRIEVTGESLNYVKFLNDFAAFPIDNIWDDLTTTTFGGRKKQYVVETNPKIVERCILLSTDPGDLVLDPTCGSGTTAYSAELWGRRWITIDTSRVALTIARTRMMSTTYPYFLLADSPDGVAKQAEIHANVSSLTQTGGDVSKGFVYERIPHITLKSIANNSDLKEGMGRKEINSIIAQSADQETLVDSPFEDSKRVRVSGPFTVETLSPHRVIAASGDLPRPSKSESIDIGRGTQFVELILEYLRKAGVQNTVRAERLVFERLEVYPGHYLNAEGEYSETGRRKRVAVCIGPEYGTVGPDLIREAAKEAVEGRGFDLLIICGFAFDPYVAEEALKYGRLTVLVARMNPDLSMGDELLKKTGAGTCSPFSGSLI